ncbi:MAG: ABC transporter ATP-binding protein, partial [Clostridia bacterium]|nr:ABC transporter ATP-binding protein [Clostridia bacterium]
MIEVKNLVKRYGDFTAVRGVSFSVRDGVICGFLGPNGAGKSTTMNIIAGTLAATEGEVVVNGYDVYEDPIGAKSSIGYLPEQPPLYSDMTAGEYLAFVGEARGLSGDKLWEAVDRAVERTGLGEYADRMIRNLSKGYRQRVGIAQAILTDPEIIILDEPTVGLDPRQIIEIRSLIRELGRDHTVILSSHILGEIAEVCDEVIIIAHGEIAAADTLENLVNRYEGKNIVDLTVRGDAETVRRIADSVPGVTDAEIEAKSAGIVRARLSADRGTDVRETVFFRFADARIPILSMSYEETTLEKVFLELT